VGGLRDIQPGERRVAAGAFLSLFGIIAGYTILETARDALFLARLPPTQLPWVYLAMALVAVLLSELPSAGAKGRMRGLGLSAALVGAALVTFAFWALGSWKSPWALRALYVWTGLVGSLVVVEFWLILGEIFTITQAKRVYRIVGTGSVLGAVAGAGLARLISMRLNADDLLLAAAAAMLATGLGPALLLRRPEASAGVAGPGHIPHSLSEIRERLRQQPYVTRLAGLTLVSTVALTLADYVFKSAVADHIPADQLGTFFATVYMVLNLLALLTQLFLMSSLLRGLGLHGAMYVLPSLLALGAGAVAFGGGLVAALLLKGADGALRQSVHRTCNELLFLPIPDGLRARVKPLIDVLGQRGGQALASVFILSELTLHRGDTRLAAAAGVLCLVWIAWAVELRPHYIELFRATLREGALHASADLPDLDLGALEVLFAALNSRDDGEVVAALDLLAEEGRVRLVPALILYHPSPDVVLKALDILADSGRTDFVPIADRLLKHSDPRLRAAALRARSSVAPDEGALRKAMGDESQLVRATALVGLVAGGWVADEAQRALDQILAQPEPAAWRELALAIAARPAQAFEPTLLEIASSPVGRVQAAVAEAMASLKSPSFLPALLPMLPSHEARPVVRSAFLAQGVEAVRFLGEALGDVALPLEIRRHIPSILSRFAGAQSIPVLERRLVDEANGLVRFQILRGLGRAAHDHPEVPLTRSRIEDVLGRTLEACFRLVHWQAVLRDGAAAEPRRRTDGHELLATLLKDKQSHALERAFRVLDLLLRSEDVKSIYRGLRSSKPKVRAGSRELIENLTQPPLRSALLALVDDTPGVDPVAAAGPYYEARPLGYDELLGLLLDSQGETLRCLAAYHVGELGLTQLGARLQAIREEAGGFFVDRVVERALRLLSGPRQAGWAPAG
jgi:ATP:ADP antiporter, AAA family